MSRLIPAFIATLPIAALLILAGLPALLEQSWRRLVRGLLLTPVAVLLPLAFFVLSAALSPEAKSVSHHGALDCFLIGKLALAPLVLWATASLYAIEVLEVRDRSRPWIIYGLIFGAIVSSVCMVFGVITYWHDDIFTLLCLLVPLYISIWYIVRTVQIVRTQPVDSGKLTIALASSLPFWAVSVLWSYKTYLSLPDQVHDCFVVTAASRGHREFVGPFLNVPHRGRNRVANQQLATLWAFETLWRNHSPRAHAAFRSIYNVIGPVIARQITSPWVADVFYVALKPVEFFARFTLFAVLFQTVKIEPRHLGSYYSNARHS